MKESLQGEMLAKWIRVVTYSMEKRFCTSSIPEKVWTSGIRTPARACKDVVVEGLFNG